MALKIDRIEGAGFENGITDRRAVRVAYVEGIPTGDAFTLLRAITESGLPQLGDPHPAGLSMTLTRHVVRPLSDSQARIDLIYETPLGPLTTGVFIVTDSSTLTQSTTQFVPGTWEPIRIKFTVGNASKEDTATISFPQIMRQRRIQAVILGTPGNQLQLDGSFGDTLGVVNDRTWHGKPIGYWLLSAFSSQTSDLGKHYAVEAVVTTKVVEDWSTAVVLRDANSGKFVAVSAAECARLRALPYKYGQDPGNGITKVGAHKVANFAQILGLP